MAPHYIHTGMRGSGVPEAQTEDRNATSTTIRRTPIYGSQQKVEHDNLDSHTTSDQSIYNMFKSHSVKKTTYPNLLEEAESPQSHMHIGAIAESD